MASNLLTARIYFFFNLFSCAPKWSATEGYAVFYNWYLMSLGFFIPTIIVVASNGTVFYISGKVITLIAILSFQ